MPRKTRSALYANIKENMGPPGNKVKLKNVSENIDLRSSKTMVQENPSLSKQKAAKMRSPLGEKNVAQVIPNERRVSVREGAKKSADKITEFCKKIRNSKGIKDKENALPQTLVIQPPAKGNQKNKESTIIEQKGLTEKPNESVKSSENHVFASPQPVPIRKSGKTPVMETATPPTITRRLSIREGARRSKDKIAEICRSIKNPKQIKATESASPQKTPIGDTALIGNNISPASPKKPTKASKATKNNENLCPLRAPTLRRRCSSPKNKNNQEADIVKTPLGKKEKNGKTTVITTSPHRMSKRKCVKPVLSESNAIPQNKNTNQAPVQKTTKSKTQQAATTVDKENSSPQKRKLVTSPVKRIINKDFSFRVLEEKSQKNVPNKESIYEFTFDPSEEPPPQKKKRKQATRKKPIPKQKPVFINNNYEENLSKKLQNLKASVQKKTDKSEQNTIVAPKPTTRPAKQPATLVQTAQPQKIQKQTVPQARKVPIITEEPIGEIQMEPEPRFPSPIFNEPPVNEPAIVQGSLLDKVSKDNSRENNVEDIEAQWDPVENDNLNYSPVRMSFNNVLSSTLNGSMRQPQDSPWRTDFETLPFKWHANSYVKPNMTPAVETSFVISDKKHVYTNMLQDDDTPPDIVEPEPEQETPKFKQSSIMSFIGEVTERTTRRTRNQKKVLGPSRANLPRTALNFAPSSDVVEKLYNQMKTATDAPEVPERNDDGTDTAREQVIDEITDSDSVHLFEDIDVVHHLKPTRKSYGKAKKLTFCKTVVDNTAHDAPAEDSDSDAERQALDDLTFELPNLKTRKPAKKKKAVKLTKKEEQEVEAWAAAFNSMCEEVEEFPLLTE